MSYYHTISSFPSCDFKEVSLSTFYINFLSLQSELLCPVYLTLVRATNIIEQSNSWDANSCSASQEIPIYEIRSFVAVFTRTSHRFLSRVIWICSVPYRPISLRCILTLSSHIRLGLQVAFGILDQRFVCISYLFHAAFILPLFHSSQ
jgi:hypothetical protein